ncbi:hypothetical protein [Rufibacter latericius]|uniref:Uncharacterized protein n=1 Tax=Rufibacter latericius TaxID=2487040 RepID=A0A3M9MY27_9BACT|nr:hypothetical protein [Rufibacter latericius]RNI30429.1 hypothetical protein EFB08_03950 [Rufibacter latericius]
MNLLNRIFGKKATGTEIEPASNQEKINVEHAKETAPFDGKLKEFSEVVKNAISFYKTYSCCCAFPRFRQIVSIDCTDYGNSFSCFETEIFIKQAKEHFKVRKIDRIEENVSEEWTCKKCDSKYIYGWSDFSIAISRQVLKPQKIKVTEVGAEPLKPIPLFVGPIGHSYPSRNELTPTDKEGFENYIKALNKNNSYNELV